MNVIAQNVRWDTDGDEDVSRQLPKYVLFLDTNSTNVDDAEEEISNALSDVFGFCHFGFEIIVPSEDMGRHHHFKADKIVQL